MKGSRSVPDVQLTPDWKCDLCWVMGGSVGGAGPCCWYTATDVALGGKDEADDEAVAAFTTPLVMISLILLTAPETDEGGRHILGVKNKSTSSPDWAEANELHWLSTSCRVCPWTCRYRGLSLKGGKKNKGLLIICRLCSRLYVMMQQKLTPGELSSSLLPSCNGLWSTQPHRSLY